MIPEFKFRAYGTHDPYAAAKAYQDKFGVKPTLLVIRPTYQIDRFHPLLYESKYAAGFAISATHEGTVADIARIEADARPARPTPPPVSEYKFLKPTLDSNGDDNEANKPWPSVSKKAVFRPPKIDLKYIREFHQNPGYVYLIASENGYQKIGRAKDVETRRQNLEREIPLEMKIIHCFKTDYYLAAEALLHDKYDEFRKKYEWFILKPEHIKEIQAISDYHFDEMLEKRLLRDLS